MIMLINGVVAFYQWLSKPMWLIKNYKMSRKLIFSLITLWLM